MASSPPKIPITSTIPSEAILFTAPGDQESAYVVLVIDPAHNIFTATKVKDKSVYTFKSTDEVVKLDAPPLFPSVVIGPILLALP